METSRDRLSVVSSGGFRCDLARRALSLAALSIWACALASPLSAQSRLFTFDGDAAFDVFGWSVSAAGDVDGDGVIDLLVGAHQPFPPDTAPGYVRVLSGADGSQLMQLSGGAPGDAFGMSVSHYTDVNGDGRADFLVGSPRRASSGPESGSVFVFSGLDGSILLQLDGDGPGHFFGRSVAYAGDVSGDGVPDFIVGAPHDDSSGQAAGSARVYSADGTLIHRFDGFAAGDEFGYSVAGAGDVNGDGRDDVIVGARQSTTGAGYACVYSGLDGSLLFCRTGDAAGDLFGSSVAGAGDVDNDGFADVIVGAPAADPLGTNLQAGTVTVFGGPGGNQLHFLVGINDDQFGTSVTGLGDVNGDGHDDFASGRRHDNLIHHTGAVPIFSGRTGEVLYEVYGDADNNFFGAAVAGVGDVNGDGTPDFFVGAFREDTHGTATGRAVLFSGACLAPVTYCTAAPHSGGQGAAMGFSGSHVWADNALTLSVSQVVPGQFGIFFYGRRAGQSPFGNGFMCMIAAPVGLFRLPPALVTDPAGNASMLLDLTQPPASVEPGIILPGSEWHFQFWYRDPAAGNSGFNLSDGLRVTFCP